MSLRRLALAVLLIVTLVLVLFTSPLTKRVFQRKPVATPASAKASAPASPLAPAPSPPAENPKLSREELATWRQRFAEAWTRDPFFTAEEEMRPASSGIAIAPPPSGSGVTLPSYTVKAVLISETARVAAINGRLLSEGEMLGEERVVEIQADGVVLERAGQRRRIKVVGGDISITEVGPRARERSDNR